MKGNFHVRFLEGGTGGNTGPLLDRTVAGKKVAHRFRLTTGGVMGFAGLWSKWKVEGQQALFTCCVITTNANELVRPFHDRMPAILAPSDYSAWFDADTPLADLRALLKPYPAELMDVSAASAAGEQPQE